MLAGRGAPGALPIAKHMGRWEPRVCGDDGKRARHADTERGTPPRVRGRRTASQAEDERVRKTPACAGTTRAWMVRMTSPAEDPRVCGDDGGASPCPAAHRGRPPRVRGRHLLTCDDSSDHGRFHLVGILASNLQHIRIQPDELPCTG